MPLPQQVVEKLSREPIKTPGWSGGVLFYSGVLLAVVVVIYAGLSFVYAPILNARIAGAESKISALSNTISASDEQQLATYYSQISNLRLLIQNHIVLSPFFAWLEGHTEANVSYANLNFSAGNQVALTATALTEADVNQQVAIFQAAPEVKMVNVSNLSFVATNNMWQFSVSLVMQPSMFTWQPQGGAATGSATSSGQ